jgi:hypothetical protein
MTAAASQTIDDDGRWPHDAGGEARAEGEGEYLGGKPPFGYAYGLPITFRGRRTARSSSHAGTVAIINKT